MMRCVSNIMNPQKMIAPATEITNSIASLQKNIWVGGEEGTEGGRVGGREEGRRGGRDREREGGREGGREGEYLE